MTSRGGGAPGSSFCALQMKCNTEQVALKREKRSCHPSVDTDGCCFARTGSPACNCRDHGRISDITSLCAACGDSRYVVSITISIFQMCVDGHRVVGIVRLRKFVEWQFKASMGMLIGRRLTENKISAAALSGFEIKTQLIGFGHVHQDAVADDKCF